jgi:invasion protein IalB
MSYRNAWMPARPVGGTLGAIAKTAAFGITLAVASASLALAQQPAAKKPPAKKPAPAQQQAAPGQPAQQEQPVQLIYSPWTKFCLKQDQNAGGKSVCFTGKDARIDSGMLVASAVLIEPQGEPNKVFRITVPLGMAIRNGTRVLIDKDQPVTAPYSFCIPAGCMADYEVNPEMIANMKKGKSLYIQAIKMNMQPITIPIPLADFAKAYDGPPTDPKVFEQEQQKLQQELEKRAEEARKKLEQSQPSAGASAAPAPGAPH